MQRSAPRLQKTQGAGNDPLCLQQTTGKSCHALDIRQKVDRYFAGQVTPFTP